MCSQALCSLMRKEKENQRRPAVGNSREHIERGFQLREMAGRKVSGKRGQLLEPLEGTRSSSGGVSIPSPEKCCPRDLHSVSLLGGGNVGITQFEVS